MVEGKSVVKPAVSEKLATLAEQRADNKLLVESTKIVRLLLNPEQAERPTSGKTEGLLRKPLDEAVRLGAIEDGASLPNNRTDQPPKASKMLGGVNKIPEKPKQLQYSRSVHEPAGTKW